MKSKTLFKNKRNRYLLFFLALVLIFASSFKKYQSGYINSFEPITNFHMADSSYFIPNRAEGWGQYNSYFRVENDSVVMEIILRRHVPPHTDWNMIMLVGTITQTYRPLGERSVNFQEPNRRWTMILKSDGKCYVKLISGIPLTGNTVVLPFKTKYKK